LTWLTSDAPDNLLLSDMDGKRTWCQCVIAAWNVGRQAEIVFQISAGNLNHSFCFTFSKRFSTNDEYRIEKVTFLSVFIDFHILTFINFIFELTVICFSQCICLWPSTLTSCQLLDCVHQFSGKWNWITCSPLICTFPNLFGYPKVSFFSSSQYFTLKPKTENNLIKIELDNQSSSIFYFKEGRMTKFGV